MLTDELIRTGICENLVEVLSMFPIEMIDDFHPTRRAGSSSRSSSGGLRLNKRSWKSDASNGNWRPPCAQR
jgi:hypothetical protein